MPAPDVAPIKANDGRRRSNPREIRVERFAGECGDRVE
jgi:hypothetical protein